jgi:hypothetical protein
MPSIKSKKNKGNLKNSSSSLVFDDLFIDFIELNVESRYHNASGI